MGKISDVEIYVHSLRDVIFGAAMLGLYFILRFPFWWLFCAHAATFLGLFFLYSSTKNDVTLPTLAGAVVLAITAVDMYALLNTICLWNRCCLHGYSVTPWSFGVRMCNLTDVYSVPSVVFLAAATVGIGCIAGLQRAWSVWSARPKMRFDVSLFVMYCGIKLWLMNWHFIVRSFLASAVLVGSMGIDLAALIFVRRTTGLAVLLFACALGLDVLVVLTRTHVVHGLSGPSTGQPTTNHGRHLLQTPGGDAAGVAYSAVMSNSMASQVTLNTAEQRRLSGAFETVRFEWNSGFHTYNSSLWNAESVLLASWQNPLFEAPLNATVTDLASYSTSLTLTEAQSLWNDAITQFGAFSNQLQTASYLYETAVVQTVSQFNLTAERTAADAATLGATAVGGGSAGAAFAAAVTVAAADVQHALQSSLISLQTVAGTTNALVVNTQQQNQLFQTYGTPAANARYDLAFASMLSSMRAFQANYRAAVVTAANALTTATSNAVSAVDASGVTLGNIFINSAQDVAPVEYESYWSRFKQRVWYPILKLVFGKNMKRNVVITSSWDVAGKVVPVPVIVNTTAVVAYSVCGGIVLMQIMFALVQKVPKPKEKDDPRHSVFFGAKGDDALAVGAEEHVVVHTGADAGALRRRTKGDFA
jgi:hypothetical protein